MKRKVCKWYIFIKHKEVYYKEWYGTQCGKEYPITDANKAYNYCINCNGKIKEVRQRMKLIVAGGRNYKLDLYEYDMLERFCEKHEIKEIVSGGAEGVDKCAIKLGLRCDLIRKITVIKANWKELGKIAGYMRNKKMAQYADMLFAFPGGKGTNNMIKTMKGLGKPIHYKTEERGVD